MAPQATSFIPKGYHSVTPYLIVRGAVDAIAFYKKALNAVELFRLPMPDGRLGHAELKIGDSHLMLADEMPEMKVVSPQTLGGSGVGLCLYVEDCDRLFKQALAAGGKVERELRDEFYGDRTGSFVDPFGHKWTIATHKEDVTPEQMMQRMPKG